MSNPNNPESGRAYAQNRDFDKGPSTYSDNDFLVKIASAAALDRTSRSLLVADLACGPGKLTSGLQGLYPRHRFLLIDASFVQIEKAQKANPSEGNQFVVADIRNMPQVETGSVDAVIARYTLKDLTLEEKVPALKEIGRIMRRGALLAVADMVAPYSNVQCWLNQQHSMKQEFEWRNPQAEGRCYIPTTKEWLAFLYRAGFYAAVSDTHMSFVHTYDWVRSGQINESQLEILNEFILKGPETTKRAFNIRTEKGSICIDYPLTIITAVKK